MRKLILLALLCSSAWAADTTLYVNTDTGSGTTCSSGSPCASLSVAEAQIPADITTGGSQGVWTIECSGSAADTTAVAIGGVTTSATYYIVVKSSTASRHAGVWSTSKYRLEVANATALQINADYVRIDGLQIGKSSSSADGQQVVQLTAKSAGNDIRIQDCLIRGAGGTTYAEDGISTSDADTVLYVTNSVIYNIAVKTASGSEGIYIASATNVYIYSTVVIGGYRSVRQAAGTVVAKNVYAGGSGAGGAYAGTITKTTCASADATGTTGLTSIAHSTANFVNVTGGSQDYHIVTGSALKDVGTDTSGDSAPLNFTTDFEGNTRSGTWDIGADEFASATSGRRRVFVIQ